MKVFIIAEVGVNHNGSEQLALDLIDAASTCGVDAVKFQSFSAEKLVLPGIETAEYQKQRTGLDDQFSMLKQLEMPAKMHLSLASHCRQLGIEFMSTPFDADAADYLVSLGMSRIKVSSGEITNHPFLERLASLGLPIILSTGMASLKEVREAVDVIRSVWSGHGDAGDVENRLTVLHCTSNYPARISDLNLRAMLTLRDELGLNVGYSDHTEGTLVPVAAVAMGAQVIEKHFTLDRGMSGPDHKASLDPAGMAEMVRKIRLVEEAMGSGEKIPSAAELPVRELVRRSLVIARTLSPGDVVKQEDLQSLRPGTGISPRDLPKVLGKTVCRPLSPGRLLQWEDLE